MIRRLRRLGATPFVVSVAASTALAQSPEAPPPQVPAPSQMPSPADQNNGQLNVAPAPGVQGQLDSSGVYTVKPGDTLWDLSGQFLNNPWYWPKIWADNPSVENPHWIYPGNRLRIQQEGEGGAGEVSPQQLGPPQSDTLQTDAEPPAMGPAPMADVSKGSLTPEAAMALASDVDSTDITPYKMPNFLRIRVKTIITDRELADTGTITNSFERKEMLSTYDKVYIQFNKLDDVKVGSTYSVFRTREMVQHPITKKPFGYQTDLLGSVRIVDKRGGFAVGEIGSVVEPLMRGDHLTLGAALEKTVQRIPNEANVSGVVLTTDVPKLTEICEDHVVFIDKGSKDGVHDGNTFVVIESGDGIDHILLGNEEASRKKPSTLPTEPIATLLVFNVRDHSSSAMVMRSIREVKIGDAAVMTAAPQEPTPGPS